MMSDDFPSDKDLTVALRKYGDHNSVLLNGFKKWLANVMTVTTVISSFFLYLVHY